MLRILIELLIFFISFSLIICLLIPGARKYWLYSVRNSFEDLWEIVADYVPGRQKGFLAIPLFLLALTLVLLVAVLFISLLLLAVPLSSIIIALKDPEKADKIIQQDKKLHAPLPKRPQKTPEEIAEENRIRHERIMSKMFTLDRKDLPYDPDEQEVFFFTPIDNKEVEHAISAQYYEIKNAFEQKNLSFVFLPYFNKEFNVLLNADKLSYYNPKAANLLRMPIAALSYQDIKEALKIPDKVDGPCFIRCKRKYEDPLLFTFYKIELPEDGDIMPIVQDYLGKVRDERFFSILSDEQRIAFAKGRPADERYADDIYLIGKEIQERIEQLRAKGLSSLAIRKLIGDDADKPSNLLIDRHNKILLTDYNNKEIKLSPIHKAVFFLFLNHPEGIYFKDLGDYREELGNIYKSITGRDNIEDIEDSIAKLTNPLDNSINEKCARIKNAFVSEFREEVAQWYFIDGKKGERKTIKLPRDLVTWEIKD